MKQAGATVGLVHGIDRRTNVMKAMNLVRDDLAAKISKRVLIKPNFLSSTNQLASSHPDALRGILDFLVSLPNPPDEVIVAEGANEKFSGDAFSNFGFDRVAEEYPFPIELFDMHQTTDWVKKPIMMADGSENSVRLPTFVLDHPCTISLAVAKTHDGCVVTLALKNMIMGSIYKPDRIHMHGFMSHGGRELIKEVQILNANLANMAKYIYPDIAVIDGTVGLQGNGPGGNDSISFGVVAASSDVYAADAVMTKAMGFDPAKLAQSTYGDILQIGVSDLNDIEVVGANLDSVILPFEPHTNTEEQLKWADEAMSKYVTASRQNPRSIGSG